jgi:hypothetical protein
MACDAIHFVISVGKNSGAAREARIDQPYHSDHLARHFLLWIAIGREIAFRMTIGALHSQRLIEVLHDEGNIGIWGKELQVLPGGWLNRAAATWLLSEQRHGHNRRCWQGKQATGQGESADRECSIHLSSIFVKWLSGTPSWIVSRGPAFQAVPFFQALDDSLAAAQNPGGMILRNNSYVIRSLLPIPNHSDRVLTNGILRYWDFHLASCRERDLSGPGPG